MRIISGTHKGKRLTAPKSLPVRPTTDFAKEALFNILNHRIHFESISLLDLFAGTGNISYEFASRGAENISCVDADFGCIKFIQKTAEELEFPIKTIKSDVVKYLTAGPTTFDVIFADPPYNFTLEQFDEMIQIIFKNELLNDEGMIIIEHSKHNDLSAISGFNEARRYGGSVFSFFEK
ncbi:16S rRNA (guanine(966)-N(2))-methyltransferase RsmD [Ulvibacter antarcticus]|uniref:16S rRNA (Guanine(966)-N(2))-methyltransferase RsmD n=1 Tax=Ulvibacter antarcticus TaxID=442714 RepID=A0A3L9YUK0_9FLAO|nr:16S rRNA (guanine(966)-N(2))-methyltransferase RsmD [Ulvibacter antarcticus]RMA64193.1 16S rRNA (guanine(966)-N(2))-methyltransferase RsmD [Ulvibacter antarcticus]